MALNVNVVYLHKATCDHSNYLLHFKKTSGINIIDKTACKNLAQKCCDCGEFTTKNQYKTLPCL